MTSVLFTLLGLSGLGVSWRWDQTGLWICMPVIWGSAGHDLSCVLRWKSWGLWTANDTWRSPSRILVTPPLGFPTTSLVLDWMPGWRGFPKQRPPRPKEGGWNSAFGNERSKEEAQARESGAPDQKHWLRKVISCGWNETIHPLMWKEFH